MISSARSSLGAWIFALFLGLTFTALVQSSHALDRLGVVRKVIPTNCAKIRGAGGVPHGACYIADVSCPGIADERVGVKVNQPIGSKVGVVLFQGGGTGSPLYDIRFKFGPNVIEKVLAAGYTTVQFNFMFPPQGSKGEMQAGWFTGPGGSRALACRWSTLAQWAHDTYDAGNIPFCATGNSAGSALIGYALAHYGMSSRFNMVEETSGPPLARIDHGCLCNARQQTPCGQGVLKECYGGDANQYLDPSYQTNACSSAERVHHSQFEQQFLHDSVASPDATYNYPFTDIHFLFGGQDNTNAPPQAMEWIPFISAKGTPTVDCVADAPHQIADVLDGADKVANDIITYCH